MQETVREVGRVAEAEGIDAHYHRGGTVTLAEHADAARAAPGGGASSPTPAGSPRTTSGSSSPTRHPRCSPPTPVLGGAFTPHCAVIHPSRLVRGLARVVEASGVPIFEQTPRAVDRARSGGDRRRHGARRDRAPRDRGLHGPAGRAAARGGAGVLADGRDRAAHRGDVGHHRAGGPTLVLRRAPPDHLRSAHGRRSAGVRRSRSAVPLRLPHPAVVRRGAAGLPGAAHRAPGDAAAAARRRVHPPVGRLPRHRPRLGRLRRSGPEHRARLGRAGTSATVSPPPTWPAARSPTWSPAPTATW